MGYRKKKKTIEERIELEMEKVLSAEVKLCRLTQHTSPFGLYVDNDGPKLVREISPTNYKDVIRTMPGHYKKIIYSYA